MLEESQQTAYAPESVCVCVELFQRGFVVIWVRKSFLKVRRTCTVHVIGFSLVSKSNSLADGID